MFISFYLLFFLYTHLTFITQPLSTINLRNFSKLNAVATNIHSLLTFSIPLNKKLFILNRDFIIPITGSIISFLFSLSSFLPYPLYSPCNIFLLDYNLYNLLCLPHILNTPSLYQSFPLYTLIPSLPSICIYPLLIYA